MAPLADAVEAPDRPLPSGARSAAGAMIVGATLRRIILLIVHVVIICRNTAKFNLFLRSVPLSSGHKLSTVDCEPTVRTYIRIFQS